MNAVTCLGCFTTSHVVLPAYCPNCGIELKVEPPPVDPSIPAFKGIEVPQAERLNKMIQEAYDAEERSLDWIDPISAHYRRRMDEQWAKWSGFFLDPNAGYETRSVFTSASSRPRAKTARL